MPDVKERKQKANQLRKRGEFKEALPVYRDLWRETGDEFDGAGYLQCLRKLKLFEEAIPLADELIAKYPDFNWCRNEVIWTYIQGPLGKVGEQEPVEKVVEIAQGIMMLKPKGIPAKVVVFKVLNSGKACNRWDIVNEWVVKIDHDSLSQEPMRDNKGREGWSDQSLWFNYRIKGLIEEDNNEEAIDTVDQIVDRFPRQRKFFLRLKAIAQYRLGNLSGSEKIYQNLCSTHKPDWWMLHEYAKVLRDMNRKEDSLKLMCKAATSHSRLELMVSLLVDIGMLCKDVGKNEEARAHLVLCKLVRDEKGWTVPDHVVTALEELNEIIGDKKVPGSLTDALRICRSAWRKLSGKEHDVKSFSYKKREVKKDLIGKVSLGRSDRPFCFINGKNGDAFFCYKSDLPPDIKDGNEVTFDAIPSFDKKKNKESWKASNIRQLAQGSI